MVDCTNCFRRRNRMQHTFGPERGSIVPCANAIFDYSGVPEIPSLEAEVVFQNGGGIDIQHTGDKQSTVVGPVAS
jgi:hypothetical protein